ncbi:MAG: AMP-binding protein [Rhizobiales bacterium]|nr:AMP-binding protein [Hyphomicrobiales bacterium]
MDYPAINLHRAAQYRAAGYWKDDTIASLVAAAVAADPDKLAVRDNTGAALTYAELWGKSARLAGFMIEQGIGRGDIVTVCMPNRCDTVVVFLAIARIGGVSNPVPVTYGRADLVYAITKCDSRALFLLDHFRSVDFRDVLAKINPADLAGRTIVMIGDTPDGVTEWDDALAAAPITANTPVGADEPATVLPTSGTESRSKGVVHTHNTVLFGENALGRVLGLGPDDVTFMASPISHTTGFMHGFVLTLITGGTLSLLDVFNGEVAAKQMADHGCTWTMGATPFLADITTAIETSGATLPKFRYFLCGGAPIPEILARRATDAGFHVLSIYGSTESPPHTIVHPQDPIENAWTTDGRPLPGIEVRVVDENGADQPIGKQGETWSRGPNTFIGYLGAPDLTALALDSDGWVHSGDLARMRPDGSIRITGRLKEIIVRGGQNISVREVEEHLIAHPAIKNAAVVAIPHERLGETGAAIVVMQEGENIDLPTLSNYLIAKGIAKFKLPEQLHIWAKLPMNPTGKIQKFIIRQKLAEPDKESSA